MYREPLDWRTAVLLKELGSSYGLRIFNRIFVKPAESLCISIAVGDPIIRQGRAFVENHLVAFELNKVA
jgi:hypothetical protein